MSTKYKFLDPDGVYFVTFAVVKWVDVFTRDIYREIVIDSLKYCQKEKGLVIHAFVIMTNHLHFIISRDGKNRLEDIMRDFKKYTSYKLVKAIKENKHESRKSWMINIFLEKGHKNSNNSIYQFWQQGNHPIELASNSIIDQKMDYIHKNPIEHGFVKEAENYPWSSASDYNGESGLIDIDILE